MSKTNAFIWSFWSSNADKSCNTLMLLRGSCFCFSCSLLQGWPLWTISPERFGHLFYLYVYLEALPDATWAWTSNLRISRLWHWPTWATTNSTVWMSSFFHKEIQLKFSSDGLYYKAKAVPPAQVLISEVILWYKPIVCFTGHHHACHKISDN